MPLVCGWRTGGRALGESVGEGLVVVGEDAVDLEGRLGQHARQKALGGAYRLLRTQLQVNPAGGAVDGHEQIAPARLVRHLRQILVVDVQVAGRVGLEAFARRADLGRLDCRAQVGQAGHAVAAQAAVKARAGDVGVEELAHHDQQVIQRQEQQSAQLDGDRLLRGRKRRLQAVRRVGAIVHVSALAPAPNGVDQDVVARRQRHVRLRRLLNLPPYPRRGGGIGVQPNVHDRSPRSSASTSRASHKG